MGRVHVAHFEAGALAGQTARAQGGNTTLVRDFRQGVGLVHELRQLRRTEELLQGCRNRLGVDQVVRHQGFGLGLAQTFLDSLLDTRQARAVLVLGQFAHATHAAVAQVVDVIDFATAIAQLDQDLDDSQDVRIGQDHRTSALVAAHAGVELHATHARQVVRVFRVEQALEQSLHGVFGRRLARAHHAVDGHAGSQLVGRFVGGQRLRDVGTLVQLVREQDVDVEDAGGAQLLEQRFGQLFVGLGNQLARVGVDLVLGQHATEQEVFGHAQLRGTGLFQLTGVTCGDALVFFDNDGTGLVSDVETGDFALEALGHERQQRACVHQLDVIELEEGFQDLLVVQADGLQQGRDRHLAATVHAEVQQVLRVEFEVEPGATIGNDAGAEQQLARRVGLALVVLEEHAWRTVQLRHDDALGTVDDERAVVGHQGHFAHVNLLLFHFLDHLGLRGRGLAVIDDHLQARTHGRCKGQTPQLALALIERRLGDVEFDELHLDEAIVRNNGERREESGLQAFGFALLGRHFLLQEGDVRILLHRQQIRHVQYAAALAKALANPLALGVAVGGCLRHKLSVSGTKRGVPLRIQSIPRPREQTVVRRLANRAALGKSRYPRLGGWPLPTAG